MADKQKDTPLWDVDAMRAKLEELEVEVGERKLHEILDTKLMLGMSQDTPLVPAKVGVAFAYTNGLLRMDEQGRLYGVVRHEHNLRLNQTEVNARIKKLGITGDEAKAMKDANSYTFTTVVTFNGETWVELADTYAMPRFSVAFNTGWSKAPSVEAVATLLNGQPVFAPVFSPMDTSPWFERKGRGRQPMSPEEAFLATMRKAPNLLSYVKENKEKWTEEEMAWAKAEVQRYLSVADEL